MERQNNQQNLTLSIIPLDKVNELSCSKQIAYLEDNLNQKAQILDMGKFQGKFYFHISKTLVNSTLFFLFGEIQDLNQKGQKAYKDLNTQKQKEFINSLFKKIFPPPKISTAFRQADFIQHIHKHSNTLKNDQGIVELGVKISDKFGPQILSEKYKLIYFNLSNYGSQLKPGKNNKKMLITQFEQTEQSIILCFYETKNPFSKNFIDQIMIEANKQKEFQINSPEQMKNFVERLKENQPQEKDNNKPQERDNNKPQEKEEDELKKQEENGQKVRDKKKQKQVTCFEVFYFIILPAIIFILLFQSQYQQLSQREFNPADYKMNQLDLKILQFAEILSPVKQFIVEQNSNYIEPFVNVISEALRENNCPEMVTNMTLMATKDLNYGLKRLTQFFGQDLSGKEPQQQSISDQL